MDIISLEREASERVDRTLTLRQRGHRILIADTSGSDGFKIARNFYHKNAFTQEARIRDFWADGDDKIIFWKKLN